MPRRPAETVQVNLRIKESLRRQLEREAEKNQVSLNYEMQRRLSASLDDPIKLGYDTILDDMKTAWERYGRFFERLELQQNIVKALAADDLDKARAAAKLLLASRRADQ